jgi:hypothetical protein
MTEFSPCAHRIPRIILVLVSEDSEVPGTPAEKS